MTLAEILRGRIAAEGPLSLADYMEAALSHYYGQGDPVGAAGDFITAPEISQMFGELIGLWCAHCWGLMGAPDPVHLVELGPGHGTLMQDALRAIGKMAPAFYEALQVHLVETSPTMRLLQAAALAGANPIWHSRFAEVPEGPLLLIANEFFDALPIRQFQPVEGGWAERLVGLGADGGFRFVLGQADFSPPLEGGVRGGGIRRAETHPSMNPMESQPQDYPKALSPNPSLKGRGNIEEIRETCPLAAQITAEIAARLAHHGGAALIIDYGYSGPAVGDTLQAVRQHAYADPLQDPGLADLTAHVDFTALAAAAQQAGGRCYGPVSQGAFLSQLGIRQRAATLKQETACRRLIDPTTMGTLFKVMAVTGRLPESPPGFAS